MQWPKNVSTLLNHEAAGRCDQCMALHDFHCKRCGNCCLYAHFDEVAEEDIHLWKKKGRQDILAWVSPKPIGNGEYAYEVWMDPGTGRQAARCPWLETVAHSEIYFCRIHDVRPSICRYFPASARHAEEVRCKGLGD